MEFDSLYKNAAFFFFTPPSSPVQSVYDFAYTAERDQLPHKFVLITNFPRQELHPSSDGGPALGELGLGRKCVLFVHDVSD